jgi:hypothetical protein
MIYYKLDGHNVVPIEDVFEWGKLMQSDDRVVAKDKVGDYLVSTVFLGIGYNFGDGKLNIFETMVFKGDNCVSLNDYTRHYSTWDEAVEGHNAVVCELKDNS